MNINSQEWKLLHYILARFCVLSTCAPTSLLFFFGVAAVGGRFTMFPDAYCGWSGKKLWRKLNFMFFFPSFFSINWCNEQEMKESRQTFFFSLMSIKYLLPIAPCNGAQKDKQSPPWKRKDICIYFRLWGAVNSCLHLPT